MTEIDTAGRSVKNETGLRDLHIDLAIRDVGVTRPGTGARLGITGKQRKKFLLVGMLAGPVIITGQISFTFGNSAAGVIVERNRIWLELRDVECGRRRHVFNMKILCARRRSRAKHP